MQSAYPVPRRLIGSKRRWRRASMLVTLILLAAGCSGLGGEPETVATLPPARTAPPTPTGGAAPTLAATEAVTGTAPPAATEEIAGPPVPTAEVRGMVAGRITNETEGGSVPANLPVELHVIDNAGNDTLYQATADAAGNFRFAEVPIRADRAYLVTVTYRERRFGSELIEGDPARPTMDLPVKLYELTDDPAAVSVSSLLVQMSAEADGLRVAQIMRLKNTTDRMFTTDRKIGEDKYASISVTLPQNATIIAFADSARRYDISLDGLTITDTVALLPGAEHLLHVIYRLPYQESGTIIEQAIPYAFDGPLQLMVGPESIHVVAKVDEQDLPARGTQALGTQRYKSYGGDLQLRAGSIIRYSLSGSIVPAAAVQDVISRELIVGVLIGGGLGLIVVGAIFLVRERQVSRRARSAVVVEDDLPDEARQEEIDRLIEELARLDDLQASGKLRRAAYEKRRRELKARLARLMRT